MNRRVFNSFIRKLYESVGGHIVIAILLALLLAVIQGAGILLLFPLLELIGISNTSTHSGISQEFQQWFTYFDLSPSLLGVLAVFMVVISVRELLVLMQSALHATIQQSLAMSLRHDLFAAVTYVNWLYFCRSTPSVFMQALITDIGRISVGTQNLITLLTTTVLTTCYLFLAMTISWEMTAVVMACGLVSALFLRRSFQKAGQLGIRQTEMNNDLFAMLTEHFAALRLTKVHTHQQKSVDLFNKQTVGMKRLLVSSLMNQAQVKVFFNLASSAIFCFFLWFAVKGMMLSSASLLVLIVLFSRVIPQVSSIWQNYNRLCQILPAFASYDQLLNNCSKHREHVCNHCGLKVELRDEIRFIDVGFHYRPDNRNILKSLNFRIKAGEFTAIIGPSGAGKSTVIDLILGLLQPVHGEVRVDGVNLADCDRQAWLNNIAYVPQNTFLFNDTIRANLLWAKPQATEQEIRRCVRDASLEKTVEKLPQGLETVVGEKGICLSGGERQRISLARALLRKASVLILDEATCELDVLNQYIIQQTLEKQRNGNTIIMISHSREAIKNADQIIVIDQGGNGYAGSLEGLASRSDGEFGHLLKQAGMV